MEFIEYKIEKYKDYFREEWDQFVLQESVNGTFLQTRRFLNYHSPDKFIDSSYVVFDKKRHIVALCPACEIIENNHKILYSHKGSTFGGIIIGKRNYKASDVINIIESLENQIIADGFFEIQYKITSDLFSIENSDLLQYCLYLNKYLSFDELNLYIDYKNYNDVILSNFSQGKRTNVNNCIKSGIQFKQICDDSDICKLYDILCISLSKYNIKPVHTISDLLALKNVILIDECAFYGLYMNDELIAGSMVFYFKNVKAAHTQYLCAKPEYNKLSPMTFLYYSLIKEIKKQGYMKLSWGITTEHMGNKINLGLTKSKESYGSCYSINKIYYKKLFI